MIRIMSFNIWGDYFGNPVEERENGIGQVISTYSPDILGIQEATASWNGSELFKALKNEYAFVDVSAYVENNFVPLLYKKDKFELIDSGFIKYPDTPDPSKGATYGVFKEISSSKLISVFCTHFWWQHFGVLEHDLLRISNAALLTAKAFETVEKYNSPAVGMGDLNSDHSMPTLTYLCNAGWKLTQSDAVESSNISSHHGDPIRGEDGKYHGSKTDKDHTKSIDHIFFRGDIAAKKFYVVEDRFALDASDHSPIYCDFE